MLADDQACFLKAVCLIVSRCDNYELSPIPRISARTVCSDFALATVDSTPLVNATLKMLKTVRRPPAALLMSLCVATLTPYRAPVRGASQMN